MSCRVTRMSYKNVLHRMLAGLSTLDGPRNTASNVYVLATGTLPLDISL